MVNKDRIEIHQTVIWVITTVTWVDINLVICRIGRSSAFRLTLHLIEDSAIELLLQTWQSSTNRLFGQVQLHHADLTFLCMIYDTTWFGIYIRIITHLHCIGQLLTLSAINRSNNDVRRGEMITIVQVIHTHDIVIAKPYWSVYITHIDNLITIEVANCGTILGIEKNHCLVWWQRCPNIVGITMRFQNHLLAIAIKVEFEVLVIHTQRSIVVCWSSHVACIFCTKIRNGFSICETREITFAQLHIAEYTNICISHQCQWDT